MKREFLFAAAVTCLLVSCEESEKKKYEKTPAATSQTAEEGTSKTPVKLAAINDETKKADGAVECLTQQILLVQQGKFDEALEYYSKKRKDIIAAELSANPAIKKEWQAATNLSEEEFKEMIEAVKEDPAFFVFEDGMWRRTDR
jgi:hypothetical protein